MADAHWLIDAEVDGRPLRYSVERVDVERVDGEVLEYAAGLTDPGEIARGDEGIVVEILDDGTDWPALAPELEGRLVVLRRWIEGTEFERAEVYARGEAHAVSYGGRTDPVTWEIVEPAGAAEFLGVQLPDPLAQVASTTAPSGVTTGDLGAYYPVVFGYPGWDGVTRNEVMPAPMLEWDAVDADTYIVVAEDGDAPITSILVRNDTTATSGAEAVVQLVDGLGRRIRAAHFGTNGVTWPATADEQRELYVGFRPADGGGVARSAYDVVAYLLRRWGPSSADWSRLPEAADELGTYMVDTWIDSPVTDPWDWIESVLIPDLPVEVRRTARGRYLAVKRYHADRTRLVGSVSVDRGQAERVSPVERADTEGPANEFVALYRQSVRGDWLGRIIMTGDSGTIASAPTASVPGSTALSEPYAVIADRRCRLSYARYGLRQSPSGPIEIDWSWDSGTIAQVLGWRAARDALPAGRVTWTVRDGADLVEGDELELTDDELGWDARLAIVDEPPVVESSEWAAVTFRVPPRA